MPPPQILGLFSCCQLDESVKLITLKYIGKLVKHSQQRQTRKTGQLPKICYNCDD